MDARLALVVLSIGTKLKALFASTRQPAGQIPFGNASGTGLDSSTKLSYNTTGNELGMGGSLDYKGAVTFGKLCSFGVTAGGAATFMGCFVKPGVGNNTLKRTYDPLPASYILTRYDIGISFHTNITAPAEGLDFNEIALNKRMGIDLAGNVAVGDHNPTERLDVAGNVKFSGALMPGNDKGAAGMVLHSNGSVSYWAYTDALKRTFGNWIVDTDSNASGRGVLKFYYYGTSHAYASIEPNTVEGVDVVGLDFMTCYGGIRYTPLRLGTNAVILPYILGTSFLKTSSTGVVSGVTLPANGAASRRFLTTDANGDITLGQTAVISTTGETIQQASATGGADSRTRFIDLQNIPLVPDSGTYWNVINLNEYHGGYATQMAMPYQHGTQVNLYLRKAENHVWQDWVNVWHSGNFDPSTFYTKTEVNALVASIYKAKGSKANYASLPTTGNTEGDVWNLIDTGENYVWVLDLNNTGVAGWDKLSGVVDLTGYAQQSWVTSNFAAANHDHTGVYEPVISAKGTAFNKDFGTASGTVAEGNHNHAGLYWEKGSGGGFLAPALVRFLHPDGWAQRIATGGVLASDDYADVPKIPANGIYSKGHIESGGGVKGTSLEATDALKVVGKTELGASVSTATTPVNTYIKLDDTHHTLLLTDDCDVELPDPATLQNTTFELVRLDEAKSVDFVGYNLNDNRNGTAWVPRAAFRSGERDMRIKAVQDPYSADWCWIVVGSTTY